MRVFIGCSSFDEIDNKYKKLAYKVSCNLSSSYDLVVGGTNKGLMKEVMKGFLENNFKVNAICINHFKNDIPHLDKRCNVKVYETLYEQLEEFSKCDLMVFLPGGYGTFTEIAYIINKKANHLINGKILFINKYGFFDNLLLYFDNLLKEHLIVNEKLYEVVEDIN